MRGDVFDLLYARGRLTPAALAAVRLLQQDLEVLHRVRMGGMVFASRVSGSRDEQDFADARRVATERTIAALSRAGELSAKLIAGLCAPDVVAGRSSDWRAVVERETRETLPDAQGALVRMACENLAGAYRMAAGGPSAALASAL